VVAGVEGGRIGRGKGRGRPYSATTVADYGRAYQNFLRPEFGPMVAAHTIRRLLDDGDFRVQARRVADEIASMPSPEAVVSVLEALGSPSTSHLRDR
jgi:hypothetical protein